MNKPETDEESRSRCLREMEAKNIGYYSVLLQTVIESELEGIKQIIALSSVGIGLQFALDRFPSGSWLLHIAVTLSIVSVLGLATAIVCGIRFLLVASKKYEDELRNENDERGYRTLMVSRTMFARWRRAAIVAFQVGVVSLAAFVTTVGIGALASRSGQPAKGTATSAAHTVTQPVR